LHIPLLHRFPGPQSLRSDRKGRCAMRALCVRALQLTWLMWASHISSFAHGLELEQALERNRTDPRPTEGSVDVRDCRIGPQSHNSGDPCRNKTTDHSYSSTLRKEDVSIQFIASRDTSMETGAHPANVDMPFDMFVLNRARSTSISRWLPQSDQGTMLSRGLDNSTPISRSLTSEHWRSWLQLSEPRSSSSASSRIATRDPFLKGPFNTLNVFQEDISTPMRGNTPKPRES
jgi:hypothetical protein